MKISYPILALGLIASFALIGSSLVTSTPASAQQGFPRVPSIPDFPGGGLSLGDLQDRQHGLVRRLTSGMANYQQGQFHVARALGIKVDSEVLQAEIEALSSGTVSDKGAIKRSIKRSERLDEEINERMVDKQTLDKAQEEEFSRGLPYYARGTRDTIELVPEFESWMRDAQATLDHAKPRDAIRIMRILSTGIFVVQVLPKYVGTMRASNRSLHAYSDRNGIDTSEAEEILGDL